MQETLQFLVMVDPMSSLVGLVDDACRDLTDASRVKPHSFELEGNWIEVYRNQEADSKLAADPVDGYHYYAGRIESTPLGPNHTEASQIRLAQRLYDWLCDRGMRAVVCANFEEMIVEREGA